MVPPSTAGVSQVEYTIHDISSFMRVVNEKIARLAKAEGGVQAGFRKGNSNAKRYRMRKH